MKLRDSAGNSIVSLSLTYGAIEDSGVDALSQLVKGSKSLKSLCLAGSLTKFGPGVQTLVGAMMGNAVLETLDLSTNPLKDTGVQKLARALEKNTALRKLSLRDCDLGPLGASRLALALGEGSTEVIKAKVSTETRSRAKVKSEFKPIMNRTLVELDLEGNKIGRKGCELFCKSLAVNGTLKTLNLSANELEDFGVISIAGALTKNSSLTDLSLRDNGLTQFGAVRLAAALEKNTSLVYLDLLLNDIGLGGCKAFNEVLEKNTTLKELLRHEV